MYRAVALAVVLAGIQTIPVVGLDGLTAGSRPEAAQGQPTDSLPTPCLRILKVIDVTDGATPYIMPGWSKDGMELGFYSEDWHTLYARKADGTGPIRELCAAEHTRFRFPSSKDSGDVRIRIDYRTRKMWIIERDGTTLIEFPHQVTVARLSPQRNRVAFGQADPNLYVSRLDGSSMVNLGHGSQWDWSPDGERLAYVSAIEQDEWDVIAADIFVGNADGSNVTQLTHTLNEVEEYPTWSPGGLRIAYSGWKTGKIYVAILEELK